jgi:hypothetical protein
LFSTSICVTYPARKRTRRFDRPARISNNEI